MQQSYWDISDILADSCRIPCTFNLDVPNLSLLRGDAPVDQYMTDATPASSQQSLEGAAPVADVIRDKSRLELPFWLAEMLALNDIVTPSLPKPYSQRVRNALDADAKSVQLRTQSTWWYALGIRMAALYREGTPGSTRAHSALLELLSATYVARLPPIYSAAQHLAAEGGSGIESGGRLGSGDGGSDGASGGQFGSRSGSSVRMSTEMIEFANGLEETEKLAMKHAHASAAAARAYLAGRH
ncbi:unnamed protein product [Parajaminaea phylloscopi]